LDSERGAAISRVSVMNGDRVLRKSAAGMPRRRCRFLGHQKGEGTPVDRNVIGPVLNGP
jgi:hypothetical protein